MLTSYRVRFTAHADQRFDVLPEDAQLRLLHRISRVISGGVQYRGKKLEGYRDVWAIRAGVYRAAYTVDVANQTILIELAGHRRDFYARLDRLPHLR